MLKENQVEVIKFLKSPEYQTVLKKYQNKYDTRYATFEAKYFGEEEVLANEAEYSELSMQSIRYKIFIERINDIKWESQGAILIREMLTEQANNIKSHLLNTVTNSFWMSKDVPVFTEDDMAKFKMLHEKDFHVFIIWIMNPRDEVEAQMTLQDKYDIYENPEDQLTDDEEIVVG